MINGFLKRNLSIFDFSTDNSGVLNGRKLQGSWDFAPSLTWWVYSIPCDPTRFLPRESYKWPLRTLPLQSLRPSDGPNYECHFVPSLNIIHCDMSKYQRDSKNVPIWGVYRHTFYHTCKVVVLALSRKFIEMYDNSEHIAISYTFHNFEDAICYCTSKVHSGLVKLFMLTCVFLSNQYQ